MDNNEDPSQYQIYIPVNFETGITILGKSYPVGNTIQGAVFLVFPYVFFFLILKKYLGINLSWNTAFALSTVIGVPCGMGGLSGIYGATFLQWVSMWFNFMRHRRSAYYNPRVKTEARCTLNLEHKTEFLSPEYFQEQIKKIMEKRKQQHVDAFAQEMAEEEDAGVLYFAEDAGKVDKPYEYMSGRERRAYRKKLRKQERRKHRA